MSKRKRENIKRRLSQLRIGSNSNSNKTVNYPLATNQQKNLLSDRVAISASIIAKDKIIRNIVHKFQQKCAYSPPLKFSGSSTQRSFLFSIVIKSKHIPT